VSYQETKQRLDAGEIVVIDGATGTELQRRGAQMDPSAWCGPASLNNSELLTQVHLDYIAAGADVITANTLSERITTTKHLLSTYNPNCPTSVRRWLKSY
jgi:S-methylmethionine-dependent homocysteine/selenocysteine methylase